MARKQDREVDAAVTSVKSICQHCKHFKTAGDETGVGWTCKAYPTRIPKEVLLLDKAGVSPHAKSRPGQKGDWVYEPKRQKLADGTRFIVPYNWDWEIV